MPIIYRYKYNAKFNARRSDTAFLHIGKFAYLQEIGDQPSIGIFIWGFNFLGPKQAQQLVDIQLSNFRPQKILLSKLVSPKQGKQIQKGEQIRLNVSFFSYSISGLNFPHLIWISLLILKTVLNAIFSHSLLVFVNKILTLLHVKEGLSCPLLSGPRIMAIESPLSDFLIPLLSLWKSSSSSFVWIPKCVNLS